MKCNKINGIQVSISGNEISNEELAVYLTQLQSQQQRKIITAEIKVDREYIELTYTFEKIPFERIRRITGYLVGTTARWGDAKQSELKDRVCHS